MEFSVITPFSRFENKDILIDHLKQFDITWYPILYENYDWGKSWIKPFICKLIKTKEIPYAKYNSFIESGLIEDNTYYSFLNDDDFYEPDFFDKIRLCFPTEQVIVVSMQRGNNTIHYENILRNHPTYTLPAAPQNMKECTVGIEQLIIKGSLLKTLKFDEDCSTADGKLARELKESGIDIRYLPDVFIWFNYLEKNRWNEN